MAWHKDVASLLRESVPEYLEMARVATSTRKHDGKGWFDFPASLLLLTIIDVIGSYYFRDPEFIVIVDERERRIDRHGARHFFILNSRYYGLTLTERQIEELYEYFRCLLAHNATLAPNTFISHDEGPDVPAFNFEKEAYWISVAALLRLTDRAVAAFLVDVDATVANSRVAGYVKLKGPRA